MWQRECESKVILKLAEQLNCEFVIRLRLLISSHFVDCKLDCGAVWWLDVSRFSDESVGQDSHWWKVKLRRVCYNVVYECRLCVDKGMEYFVLLIVKFANDSCMLKSNNIQDDTTWILWSVK
jgi:hypothetical protein